MTFRKATLSTLPSLSFLLLQETNRSRGQSQKIFGLFVLRNISTWCPHCVYVFCTDLRTNSNFCLIKHKETGFYNRSGVFTARYALSPYIKQIRFVFKGLTL
jgi:hypothetical protein